MKPSFAFCQHYSAGTETIVFKILVHMDHRWMKFSVMDIKVWNINKYHGTEFSPPLAPSYQDTWRKVFQCPYPFTCSGHGLKWGWQHKHSILWWVTAALNCTGGPCLVMLHPQHVWPRTDNLSLNLHIGKMSTGQGTLNSMSLLLLSSIELVP